MLLRRGLLGYRVKDVEDYLLLLQRQESDFLKRIKELEQKLRYEEYCKQELKQELEIYKEICRASKKKSINQPVE